MAPVTAQPLQPLLYYAHVYYVHVYEVAHCSAVSAPPIAAGLAARHMPSLGAFFPSGVDDVADALML